LIARRGGVDQKGEEQIFRNGRNEAGDELLFVAVPEVEEDLRKLLLPDGPPNAD